MSDNPALAARRSVSLFGSFLFGVYCFTRFRLAAVHLHGRVARRP
ncbi:MAG: hypothetical protein WDN69_12765 [Aliidongia sp.]